MSDKTGATWVEDGGKLRKNFVFPDFPQAMGFMLRVSYECEKMNHHPEWKNVYNKVSVELSTHDAGDKVTDKDHKLAEIMDRVSKHFT